MVKGFKDNEAGDITTVVTTGGEYDAELVILCVGFRPSTELVKGQVEMMGNGAIIVNDYMQTSLPDVYAAGDSCAVNYNPNGGHAYIPLATNAVRMGMLVGKTSTDLNEIPWNPVHFRLIPKRIQHWLNRCEFRKCRSIRS